jgi:uncharacterized protein (UPF0297 family)
MILNNNERIIIKTAARPAEDGTKTEKETKETFYDICRAIKEGGYNPTTQIVGYLISEDPTHITNYKGARTMATKLDRDELMTEMVAYYIAAIENEFKDKD